MSDNGITIEADTAILSHKRRADQGLMNGFARANVSKAHLRKRNLCRLYLQITHLSDISTGDGFRINAQFMGTDREPPFREATRNQFVWPRQPCPPITILETLETLHFDHVHQPRYGIGTVTWTLDTEGRRVQKKLGLVRGYGRIRAMEIDRRPTESTHFDQPSQTYTNTTIQSYPITPRGRTPLAHHKNHDHTHR